MQSKRPPGERTPPAFIMSTLLFGGRKTTGRRLSPKSTIASPTPTSAVSSAPVLSRSRNNNALSTTSSVTHTAADVLGRVQLSLEELRTKFRELDEVCNAPWNGGWERRFFVLLLLLVLVLLLLTYSVRNCLQYNKNLREEVREIKARAQQEAATRYDVVHVFLQLECCSGSGVGGRGGGFQIVVLFLLPALLLQRWW